MFRSREQAGFTLLEAIVALVLLSSTLAALYTWINTDLIALRRAEAVVATNNAVREVVSQLQLLPFEDNAGGRFRVSGYEVVWQSSLVEKAIGRSQRGSVGLYDHQLFQVNFTISTPGEELGSWGLRQARFIRARSLQYE